MLLDRTTGQPELTLDASRERDSDRNRCSNHHIGDYRLVIYSSSLFLCLISSYNDSFWVSMMTRMGIDDGHSVCESMLLKPAAQVV